MQDEKTEMNEQQPKTEEALTEGQQQGSSRATEDPEKYQENVNKVDKLVAEGHKLMLAETFDEAAEVLANAVELSTEFFGTFAHQSFLPHFTYGKALIEVARLESLPIKAPLENIEEESEDDEEDEEAMEEEEEGVKEGEQQNGKSEDEKKAEGNEEEGKKPEESSDAKKREVGAKEEQNGKSDDEKKAEGNEEDGKKPEEKEVEAEEKKAKEEGEAKMEQGEKKKSEVDGAEGKDEDGKQTEVADETIDGEAPTGEDEEEDGNDIQLAWETLEIARKICENHLHEDEKLWAERMADVLVALGDCMSVAEEFQQALGEFNNALEIRKAHFGPLDRRIAESYFWIGRTHKLLDDFGTAADAFGESKKVLDALIELKEKELNEKTESDAKGCEELAELKGVVKGVEESIQDALESAEQQAKHMAELKAALHPMMQQLSCNSQSTKAVLEADDITSMVKRKPAKRPLEQNDDEENGGKKADEGQLAEHANGHEKKASGQSEEEKEGQAEGRQPPQKLAKLVSDDGAEVETVQEAGNGN